MKQQLYMKLRAVGAKYRNQEFSVNKNKKKRI